MQADPDLGIIFWSLALHIKSSKLSVFSMAFKTFHLFETDPHDRRELHDARAKLRSYLIVSRVLRPFYFPNVKALSIKTNKKAFEASTASAVV